MSSKRLLSFFIVVAFLASSIFSIDINAESGSVPSVNGGTEPFYALKSEKDKPEFYAGDSEKNSNIYETSYISDPENDMLYSDSADLTEESDNNLSFNDTDNEYYSDLTTYGDEVYYSDIFYAYDTDYLKSDYFKSYSSETYDVTNQIYADYLDSPSFAWTEIKTALNAALDIKEWIQIVSDGLGVSDFTYQRALLSANEKFAQNLLSGSAIASFANTNSEWLKRIKSVLKVFDEFENNYDVYELTDVEVFEQFFLFAQNDEIYMHIGSTVIMNFREVVLPDFSGIIKVIGVGKSAWDAVKILAIGLMLEDFRFEVIDEIIEGADSDSTLYDGMTQLKQQLRNGFISYFIDNYLTKTFFDKISDGIVDKLTNAALGDLSALYGIVSTIGEVLSWIIFDVAFDVPDLDDLTLQRVLSQYATDFYILITDKIYDFNKQFEISDIETYESFFMGFKAATDAAFEASEKLALDSNIESLNNVKNKFKDFSYAEFIDNLIKSIEQIPADQREYKTFEEWVITTPTIICNASDTLEKGYLYLSKGVFRGNLTLLSDLSFESEISPVISGNLTIDGSLSIAEKQSFTVEGNCTVSETYYGSIINDGIFRCTEDMILGNDWYNGYFYQDVNNEARLIVGGNLTADNFSCTDYITHGTVILNGSEQQEIKYLKAYNIEVMNKAGIKYLTDTMLFGHYDLNGSPLDNNGFTTSMYTGATLASGDYKNVTVLGDVTLNNSIKGDLNISGNYTLTVAEGPSLEIEGDVVVSGNLKIPFNQKFTVEGSCTVSDTYYGSIINDGIFRCTEDMILGNDWYNGYFYQNVNNEAKLIVGGNLTADNFSCTDYITRGTVILNGSEQQEIKYLKAYNIEVMNKAGIKYLTDTMLFGHYDLKGSPLDNNGFTTSMYTGATLASGDYKNVTVLGDITLYNSIKGDLNISGNYTLTVADGSSLEIEGDVVVNGSLIIPYNRKLAVAGDCTISDTYYGSIINDGIFRCTGDMIFKNDLYNGHFYQNSNPEAQFILGGDLIAFDFGCTDFITNGTVVLNGSKQQEIQYLKAYNIEVINKAGIKYLTDTMLFGHYDLNGCPLDNNGFTTSMYTGATLASGDYKNVTVLGDITLYNSIKGDLNISGNYTLTVADGPSLEIEGDVAINGSLIIPFNRKLTVEGSCTVSETYYGSIINDGIFCCTGNMIVANNLYNGYFYQKNNFESQFILGGNLTTNNFGFTDSITQGTVILDGDKKQILQFFKAPSIIIENESTEGVVFTNSITVPGLFDHRNNVFTLYNGGEGSVFIDYDRDGIPDNLDPQPTVGKPCILEFTVNNSEYGTVSESRIETADGAHITVIAESAPLYEFVCWIDEDGYIVGVDEEFEFTAMGSNKYIAVFEKRKFHIIADTNGGTINVSEAAEPGSRVTVTVIEDEGYVFDPDSLKYNDIQIDGTSFIMPAEDVVLTAVFNRNPYYFILKEKITESLDYLSDEYTQESIYALQSAITTAQSALMNNINKSDCERNTAAIDNAVKGLKPLVFGDVTGDGILDIRDYVRMKKLISGMQTDNPSSADINDDQLLNALDLTALRKILLAL